MYITDHTTGIALSDRPLTSEQVSLILASPNAMRGILSPPSAFPGDEKYLQANAIDDEAFMGAVLWQRQDSVVNIHPLVIIKDLTIFHTITDLAILFALNQTLKPITTVLPSSTYSYMHKFVMEQVGCLHIGVGTFNTYRLPHGWRPRMVKKYTIGME